MARKLPLGLIPAGSSNALLVSVNGHANPAAHAVYIATGCLAAVDILEMSPLLPATRDLSSPVPSTPNTTATTTTEQPLVLSAPLPRKSKAVVSDGVSTSTRASRPAAIDAKRKVQLRPKSAADSPADTRKQQRRKSADPALESDKREEQAEDDEDIDSGRPSASKAKTRKPLPSDVVEVGSTEEDADEEAFSADVHAEDAFKASPPNCSVSSMPSDGPRYGFVVVGTGFVGVVAKQAEAFRWMGPARYSYCAVKHFADPQFHQLRVRYLPVRPQRGHMEGKDGQKGIEGDGGDGGEEADPWVEVEGSFFNFFAFNVSGANAQTPPVLPDAKLDDGKFLPLSGRPQQISHREPYTPSSDCFVKDVSACACGSSARGRRSSSFSPASPLARTCSCPTSPPPAPARWSCTPAGRGRHPSIWTARSSRRAQCISRYCQGKSFPPLKVQRYFLPAFCCCLFCGVS